ncbi:MAG: hypothetical protein MZW92_15395 [Comamonadaceae bacterium]|nr:hypothetical protein [Comamonadaceae bacterium]
MAEVDPSGLYDPTDVMPLDEEDLAALGERLESLPLEDAEWVARVFAECRRARASESSLLARDSDASGRLQDLEQDLAQIVLDAAEWLRTLWAVGYMGGSRFPSAPRTEFPVVEVEDVLKSALFARIRQGKRPLPFPPPTRGGVPWHELVEAAGPFQVQAEIQRDDEGKAIGALVEACPHWDILSETVAAREYLVQHRAKGPVHRRRWGPRAPRSRASRRGGRAKSCSRSAADSAAYRTGRSPTRRCKPSLRATTWDRAEAEALHWIALHHPEMYGQVRFERLEARDE